MFRCYTLYMYCTHIVYFCQHSRLNVWHYTNARQEKKTNLFTEFSLMNLLKHKKNTKRIKKTYKKRVHTRGKWNWTKFQRRRRQMYVRKTQEKKRYNKCGGYAWSASYFWIKIPIFKDWTFVFGYIWVSSSIVGEAILQNSVWQTQFISF